MPTFSSSLRPAIVLLVLCLCGVATTATLGVAADAGGTRATSASDRGEQHATRAAEARAERRRAQEERQTAAARAERDRSRSAFKGQGRDDALATARRHHGRVIDAPVADPLPLRPGERVDEVLTNNTARIDLGGGKHGLATSTLPLRVDGRPFSLALRRRGDDLAPENSTTDVTIGGRADAGVTMGSGVRFTPAGATGSEAHVVADKAFFANALTAPDVDYVVQPIPGGVEALFVLRSADSPQAPALDFELPAGARLRSDGRDGAEVVRDGDVLARIARPAAWDADDVDVPTRYVIHGSTLTVRVDHADGDFRYPVLVDPPVVEDSFDCILGWCDGTSFPGWVKKPDSSHISAGYWQYGLLAWYPANTYNSIAGWRDWRFYAVRESHVYRFNSRHDHRPARSHLTEGISPRDGQWEGEYHFTETGTRYPPPYVQYGDVSGRNIVHCAAVGCAADYGSTRNFAQHGIWVETGSSSAQATTQLGAATVYQWDRNNPWVERVSDTIPAGWMRGGSLQISVRGRDAGLGVARNGLSGENFTIERTKPCANFPTSNPNEAGNQRHQCRDIEPDTFDVDTTNFRQGINHLTAYTDDVILRPRGHTSYSFRKDTEGPEITLSGALWDKRAGTVTGWAPLTVDLKDGSAGDTTSRSGAKRIELWVDDRAALVMPGSQSAARSEPTCDNCTLGTTLHFDAADLDDGAHKITVKAWDYAGNESSTSFDVVTDTRSPTVVATRHAGRPASSWIDSAVPTVDLRVEDGGGGVFSHNLEEPDGWKTPATPYSCNQTPAERCASPRTPNISYNVAGNALTQGINSVNARAKDPFDGANPTLPPRQGRGLRAEYWTDAKPTPLYKTVSRVEFNWGTGGPHHDVGADFSARFFGKVIPKYTETYRFYGLADDTVKLYVDGQLMFDDQTWDGTEEWADIALQAGRSYDIYMETKDTGGEAKAHLKWSSPSQPKKIIPGDRLFPPTAYGLFAEFFDNKDLTGAAYRRYGVRPNSVWGTGAAEARMGADTWSVRYLGQVTPRYTDTYTFYTRSDDGTRLWVDGKQLIDNFVTTGAVVERSGQVTLEAGKPYDLRLEYLDDTGNASLYLDWQSPQQAREVVPLDRLASPAGTSASWPVKVDQSPPIVEPLKGPLPEIEGEYVEGPTPVDFQATDGATTTPRTQRSGVKSWEIDTGRGTTIPGGARTTVEDSQPWNDTTTIAPSNSAYLDGRNDIGIAAMDQLHPELNRHRGVSPRVSVWMDKTPPMLALSGGLKEAENAAIWDGSYDLVSRANDGAFEDPRSGVRQVEVFLGKQNADGSVSQETSVHRSRPLPGRSVNLLPNSSNERMWATQGAPFRWGFRSTLSRVQDAAATYHGNWASRITARETGDVLMISDAARMSAEPGQQITMSGYLRASANGRSAHIAPRWFNASGQMSESNAQFKPVSTSLSRYTATWTAPSDAVSFGWKVAMRGHAVGDHLDVDALQVERGGTTTPYAPRVTLNLFSNTSFEKAPGTDATAPAMVHYAATSSRVQDPDAVEHGAWAVRLRPNGTPDAQLINDVEKVPVTPGERLNFSAFLHASATGASARVHGRFFDANGAFVGQQGGSFRPVDTTRHKHATAITVPANATQLGWVVTVTGHNGSTATPTTIDIDAVQVDRGSDDSEYVPLSTPNLFSNTSFERPSGQDGAPHLHPYAPAGTWSRIQDAAAIHHGRWAARLSATTTTDHQLINDGEQVPVQWGERITFTGYGRSSAAQGQWTVSPRWRSDAGQFLGQHTTGWKPMTTTRQRFTGSAVVPQGATLMGWVVTMTGHAPGQTLDVDAIQAERAELPSRYRHNKLTDYHHTTGWTFTPSQHAPGKYRIRVRATDHLGQSTDSSFVTEVDSPPELVVEGGLRSSPLATGRSLKATATDTYSGIDDIRVYAWPTSADRVSPDETIQDPNPTHEVHAATCTPDPANEQCRSAGGFSTSFDFPDDRPSGRYEFWVRAKDRGTRKADERWVAEIVQTRSGQNEKLGLEQWFDLDDTDAGGDSTLFVNGETGNVIWHQVPIVNPGRGLSSVVNLTYNSQARNGLLGLDATRIPAIGLNPEDDSATGRDLTGHAYNQAGVGFSLAIGGPTRVNEPLGGVVAAGIVERMQDEHSTPWPGLEGQNDLLRANGLPGVEPTPSGETPESRITLTDADGTQHRFTRGAGDPAWTASPGLNMRLRYREDARLDLTAPDPDPKLPALDALDFQEDRAWDLVRPDGVTFTFDSFGYLRETTDRNGNTLRYFYETYSSVTGEPCDDTALVGRLQAGIGVCIPRLREVRQPTWAPSDDPDTRQDERDRKISLEYTPLEQSPGTPSLLDSFGLPAGTLLGATYMLGAGPQVDFITDAKGLTYDFEYSASPALSGYLEDFTENAGDAQVANRRTTRFRYCEGAPCASLAEPEDGDAHQLTAVIPVDGTVEGEGTQIEYPARGTHPFLPPAPRRAQKIVKRGGGLKHFRYVPDDDLHGDRFVVHERELGDRYLTRRSEHDHRNRPIEVVESASRLAGGDPEQAEEVTSQGSTTTKLAWVDTENKPDWVVEAAGDAAERKTDYTYLADGTGALTRVAVADADATETHTTTLAYYADGRQNDFIADLHLLTLPGGREWKYESDAADGNVDFTTSPAGRRMATKYGTGGVVTDQQDEMYRWTTFANHDLGGNPETVTLPADGDPQTDPGPRRHEYRYDERGDVTRIIDPRGDVTTTDGDPVETDQGDPYVTTLEYDAYARLTREHIPRLSGGGAGGADGPAFVERTRRFDRNGNAFEVTDARGKLTEIHYDPMGQPDEVKAPGSRAPGTADDAPEADKYPPDITRFVYDDAQRMISATRPNGAAASAAEGFATTVRDEHLAACEQAGAQGEHPFTTRFCLDHAGRPLGEVEYSTRAADIARRIVTFRYDGRGNVTRIADPNRNTDPETDPATEPDQTPLTIANAIAPATVDARYRLATSYDVLDRPLTQEDRGRPGDDAPALTRTYSYTDDADQELDRIVDEHGDSDRIVKLGHDDMGRLKYRTNYPEGDGEGKFGRTTCVQRQHDGLVTAIATPRAGTTQAQCLADHDFAHSTTEYTYNAAGDVLSRTIPRAAGQYGPEPDAAGEWTIRYERDVVGNAEKIFDAKGNPAIENTFFDGGELKSTTRPSFFGVSWPGAAGNPDSGRRFGGGDAADVEVARGGPAVSERGLRSANAAMSERRPAAPSSLGKGDLGDVTPEPLPSWLPQAGATTLRYDEAMQLTEIEDAAGEERKISYDPAGRVETKSWPMVAENPGTEAVEKEEIVHAFRYDDDGNLASVKEDWQDGLYVDTSFEYDGYGRRITESAEGAQRSPTDAVAPEVTRFRYDANDNVRFRVTPRPVAPGSDDRLTFEFEYDSRDNLRSEVNPAGEQWEYAYNPFGEPTTEIAPHAAGAVTSRYTTTLEYDRAGQLAKQTKSVDVSGATDRALVWEYDYDADGNLQETTAPGSPTDVITRVEHDGRGLPWRKTVTDGQTGGTRRVTITEHDANGNLRRLVKPTGIDLSADEGRGMPSVTDDGTDDGGNLAAISENATVFRYDSSDLLVEERLPWRGSADKKYFREWKRELPGTGHRQRFLTAINHPRELGGSDAERGTLYDQNAAGWIIRSRDNTRTHESDDPFDPEVTYSYDQRGNQTRWRSVRSASDTGRDIRRTYWANGLVRRRSAIKTTDTGADDETTRRHYDYYYNENRSLVQVVDDDANRTKPGDQTRSTTFRRDTAEREEHVDEQWTKGKDVELVYEAGSGRLLTRRTDGVFDGDGAYTGDDRKSTTFTYDSLGRELSMEVQPHGRALRTTTTRWHDGGQVDTRTKPNGTVDEWDWDVLGQKTMHVRDPQQGPTEEQEYKYDDDGNRRVDERGEHEFNARDQLIRWQRPDDATRVSRRGWTTKYVRLADGQIDLKTEHPKPADGEPLGGPKLTHDYTYDGDRLSKVQTTDEEEAGIKAVTTQTFGYDTGGNVVRVRSKLDIVAGDAVPAEPVAGETSLDPEECPVPPETAEVDVTRYCFDEFNRQTMSWGKGVERPSHITHDGLDRRDSKRIEDDASNELERRDYSYIGTSELLASESITTAGTTTLRKRLSFDYDSRGARQGMQKEQGTTFEYSAYAKDANGSVLALEEDDGSTLVTKEYDYDPYGELDRDAPEASGGDELELGLDEDAKDNPFRFEGFYYDSGVKTYDMHARHYRPEIGQFLSSDQFESAAGDMALQADPLTQNRYAFAGGNPVSNIEFDGHKACTATCKADEHMMIFNGDAGGKVVPVNASAGSGPAAVPGLSQTPQAPPPPRVVQAQNLVAGLFGLGGRSGQKQAAYDAAGNPPADGTYTPSVWVERYPLPPSQAIDGSVWTDLLLVTEGPAAAYAGYKALRWAVCRAFCKPRTGVIRGATTQAIHGATGDVTEDALTEALEQALKEHARVGLTPRQAAAVGRQPTQAKADRLQRLFVGERIDRHVRDIIDAAPGNSPLGRLEMTPRGTFGPDLRDPVTGRWYDITTPGAWSAHLRRYNPRFGPDGVGIVYNPL